MEDAGIGWIGAIFIGGIAGWLAAQITRSNMGLIPNIILGVIGAVVQPARGSVTGSRLAGLSVRRVCRGLHSDPRDPDDFPHSMAGLRRDCYGESR